MNIDQININSYADVIYNLKSANESLQSESPKFVVVNKNEIYLSDQQPLNNKSLNKIVKDIISQNNMPSNKKRNLRKALKKYEENINRLNEGNNEIKKTKQTANLYLAPNQELENFNENEIEEPLIPNKNIDQESIKKNNEKTMTSKGSSFKLLPVLLTVTGIFTATTNAAANNNIIQNEPKPDDNPQNFWKDACLNHNVTWLNKPPNMKFDFKPDSNVITSTNCLKSVEDVSCQQDIFGFQTWEYQKYAQQNSLLNTYRENVEKWMNNLNDDHFLPFLKEHPDKQELVENIRIRNRIMLINEMAKRYNMGRCGEGSSMSIQKLLTLPPNQIPKKIQTVSVNNFDFKSEKASSHLNHVLILINSDLEDGTYDKDNPTDPPRKGIICDGWNGMFKDVKDAKDVNMISKMNKIPKVVVQTIPRPNPKSKASKQFFQKYDFFTNQKFLQETADKLFEQPKNEL